MKCDCGSDTRTVDTRKIELGVWRRRSCPACGTGFTTLEQRCETTAAPYLSSRTGKTVEGAVKAPQVPKVQRPNPPEKRAKALRPPSPTGKADPAPAAFAPDPTARHKLAPRPATVPVDRVTPSARDRIEDLKFEREQNNYGWDK